MKKIMFSDKYSLTDAVLNGIKTQTRRIVPDGTLLGNFEETLKSSRYDIGEVVAIAQSYNDVYEELKRKHGSSSSITRDFFHKYIQGGRMPVSNKMFVKAELMPHRIKITDIRVERLQDISDEDCLKEGVIKLCESYRTTASDMFFIRHKKHSRSSLIRSLAKEHGKTTPGFSSMILSL